MKVTSIPKFEVAEAFSFKVSCNYHLILYSIVLAYFKFVLLFGVIATRMSFQILKIESR